MDKPSMLRRFLADIAGEERRHRSHQVVRAHISHGFTLTEIAG